MGIPCNYRWKHDDRFIRFPLPKDENKEVFVPVCIHPNHIGIVRNSEYRLIHCEKRGSGKFCKYYHIFRDEKTLEMNYHTTQSIEVTINEGNG